MYSYQSGVVQQITPILEVKNTIVFLTQSFSQSLCPTLPLNLTADLISKVHPGSVLSCKSELSLGQCEAETCPRSVPHCCSPLHYLLYIHHTTGTHASYGAPLYHTSHACNDASATTCKQYREACRSHPASVGSGNKRWFSCTRIQLVQACNAMIACLEPITQYRSCEMFCVISINCSRSQVCSLAFMGEI